MQHQQQCQILKSPLKSKYDCKEYRSLILSNGLRVLLVSNRNNDSSGSTSRSAASLCIGVGGFSDPESAPGLANFLQLQTMFASTEKYPDKNIKDLFCKSEGGFGGECNYETTVFNLEIEKQYFREGLDHLGQLFTAPLFNGGRRVMEEMEGDVAYGLFLQQQLLGSLFEKSHPMGKMRIGNIKYFLKDEFDENTVLEVMNIFRKRHYTGRCMTLAVQSKEELDIMQSWVQESFGAIPDNGMEREIFPPFAAATSCISKLFKLECSAGQERNLDLKWLIPIADKTEGSVTLRYLSWLIGHEDKGSLLSHLRRNRWAEELSSWNPYEAREEFYCNSICITFSICIELTKKGQDELPKVVEAVFSYLKMLQAEGPSERIFKEIKAIRELEIEEEDDNDDPAVVGNLSRRMMSDIYQPEQYVIGDSSSLDCFNPELIEKYLNQLIPDSVMLMATSPDYKCDKVEPFKDEKYSEEEVPEEWIKKWKEAPLLQSEMYLPEPSKFLPENCRISYYGKKEDNPSLAIIINEEEGELWYKHDSSRSLSETWYSINISSPFLFSTATNAAATDLMVNCIRHSLREDAYSAELAKLKFQLHVDPKQGIALYCCGLTEKMTILLETIMTHIADFEANVTPETFEEEKEKLEKFYTDNLIMVDQYKSILLSEYWTRRDKVKELPKSLEEVIELHKQIFSCCYLQVLAQGTVTQEDAEKAYNLIKLKLNAKCHQAPTYQQCNILPLGELVLKMDSGDEPANRLLINYYQQSNPATLLGQVTAFILVKLLNKALQVEFGGEEDEYWNADVDVTGGILGIVIMVCHSSEDSKASTEDEDSKYKRAEEFMQKYLENGLDTLTEEEINETVEELIKSDSEYCYIELSTGRYMRQKENVYRNWSEIISGDKLFNRKDLQADLLKTSINREMVAAFMKDLMENKRKVCVKLEKTSSSNKNSSNSNNSDNSSSSNDNNDNINSSNKIKSCNNSPITVWRGDEMLGDCEQFKKEIEAYPVNHIIE